MATAASTLVDAASYLAQLARDYQLGTADGRRLACVVDPLAFALVYLPHVLTNPATGHITLGEPHTEWVELAKQWITGAASRNAFIAPRNTGKSTWWFKILPLWGAAFGHIKYAAAFADSANQAQTHLATYRAEIASNALLAQDFPDLCQPEKRNGKPVSDNANKFISANGFIFEARGADASNLGMKTGDRRPDLLILDDIEPDESNYSPYLKDKRLTTVLDSILYMNLGARVVVSGTVTMPGSIIHDLVRSIDDSQEPEPWVTQVRPAIKVHHHLPILEDKNGDRRSCWPGLWSLEYLETIEDTPSYRKNFANSPMAGDGQLWKIEDIKHNGSEVEGIGGWLLSIDPAVTDNKKSDYTGLALIGWSKQERKCVVFECWQVKLGAEALASRVSTICETFPVSRVLVETNQGGQVWQTILKNIPVPLSTVHQTDKKEVRAARVYVAYTKGHVVHAKPLAKLEEQLVAFPKSVNDDMVDAVTSGVAFLSNVINENKKTRRRSPITQGSYL